MTAFLIGLSVAAFAAHNHGHIPGKQYVVLVSVYSGDPLGSREAGTVEVITSPQVCLTLGQTGFFQVGGRGDQEGNEITIRAKLTELPPGSVRLALDYQHDESHGYSSRPTTATFDRPVTLGKPVTYRMAARSPTQQVWAIVTVTDNMNAMFDAELLRRSRGWEDWRGPPANPTAAAGR